MQARHHESGGLITTAVLAVLVVLVGLGGALKLARSAADLGPSVGDILVFGSVHRIVYGASKTLEVSRVGQPGCVVNLGVIRQFGGSMIIDARTPRPNRLYQAHWAGQRSSMGPNDCGRSAELELTATQLEILALTAGGYGVGNIQSLPGSGWQNNGTEPGPRR